MGLMDFLKKGDEKPENNPAATNGGAAAKTTDFTQSPSQPTDTYTVKSGDSLSKIAKVYYGSEKEWPKIFEANRDQIKDANLIEIGQVLKIPKA
jgi:nucleoid-associated protein YgaU